jgi:hypothetical protein
LYEKYTHAERTSAKVAAARAATRISVLRSPGISSSRTAAMAGVKTMTLKIGNCILHLAL